MSGEENIVTVDDETYEDVIAEEPLVLLYFRADWAGTCQAQDGVMQRLAETHPELLIARLDIDENEAAVDRFDVRSLPSMVLFVDGEPVETLVGRRPLSALTTEIEDHA